MIKSYRYGGGGGGGGGKVALTEISSDLKETSFFLPKERNGTNTTENSFWTTKWATYF